MRGRCKEGVRERKRKERRERQNKNGVLVEPFVISKISHALHDHFILLFICVGDKMSVFL